MTETGMSLGTPHYMAPEQAMGEREITPKADIYALGCVLYEMLTAEPPFVGATAQAIIARVMTEEPRSLTLQRKTIPPHVEAAVHAALAKLPADRFASAAEFAAALANPDATLRRTAARRQASPAMTAVRRPVGALLVAVGVIGGGALGWALKRPPPTTAEPVRFSLIQQDSGRYVTSFGPSVALSPDGRTIAYSGAMGTRRLLFLRRLDALEPVPVGGTDNAYLPFFSPDGQWLGFVANQRLMKVALAGGAPLLIAELEGNVAQGAAWGPDGVVVLEDVSGLSRVSAAGGALEQLTSVAVGGAHEWPSFLPDGRVLFTISGDTVRPAVVDPRTRAVTRIDVTGNTARYAEPGWLLLADEGGTVTALPFDVRRLRVTGEAVPVLQGVDQGDGDAAKFAVAAGVAVHVAGRRSDRRLLFLDRRGQARVAIPDARRYAFPRLSPDGRRVAVAIASSAGSDIWVVDPARGLLQRITFSDSAVTPEWTPDGRRLAYGRDRGPGQIDLFWTAADGSGRDESLLVSPGMQFPSGWSPDGRTLVYRELDTATGWDIMALALGDRRLRPVVQTRLAQLAPTVSPDGRWLAYISNESGRREVYVRPFPEGEGRWQISLDGGVEPRWSRGGREIIYRSGDRFLAVAVETSPAFVAGRPDTLFQSLMDLSAGLASYDVSRDGQLIVGVGSETSASEVVVTLNPLAGLGAARR
jgi:serine/threonine-protein kinase